MRRRAGNMGDAARVQPRDMIGERLVRLGQHHRAAADDGAQENLQAAIAADVVERRPHRRRTARAGLRRRSRRSRPSSVWPTIFGTPDVPEVSISHSVARSVCAGARRRRPAARRSTTSGMPCRAQRSGWSVTTASISASVDQGVEMIGIEIGRAQQHAPGDAVDLDHREARQQLAGHRQQHRAPGQLAAATVEAGLRQDIGQRDACAAHREMVRPFSSGLEIVAEREDLTRGHFRRPGRNRRPSAGTPRPPRW